MERSKIFVSAAAVILAANSFLLSGCGGRQNGSPQTDTDGQSAILDEGYEILVLDESLAEQSAENITQGQGGETAGIMREYSEKERNRMEKLEQSYQNERIYPEKLIQEVDSSDEVTEGTLCYIRSTREYYLPDRELTDEELLEIIDCNFRIAIAQSPAAQEAREEYLAEEARLKEIIQNAGGISGEEAVLIAKKQMEADLGEAAKDLELMTDHTGNGATLMDISGEEYESKAGVAYDVGFGNPDTHFTYGYIIDAVDGTILYTWK